VPARTPAQAHEMFAQYFNAGDLEALVSLYEPGATMVPQPGPAVSGHEGIREVLAAFLALKGELNLTVGKIFQADDIALLFSDWTLKGTGQNGEAVEMSGRTSDVVRRQPDGAWLFIIDNPYGAEAAST
jgi:uncharacterized protein (TIGR02246 family)